MVACLAPEGRGVVMVKDDNTGFKPSIEDGQKEASSNASQAGSQTTITWVSETTAAGKTTVNNKPTNFKN